MLSPLNGRRALPHSLALAAHCVRACPPATVQADDPLRLNLPPLLTHGAQPALTPDALRVIAALYLQAELEQAGIVAVADLLAQARMNLGALAADTARKLDEFARRSRDWYDRNQRAQLFGRVFGLGYTADADQGGGNRQFQHLFAVWCVCLTRYGETYQWRQQPGSSGEAALRQASTDLLFNLAPAQFGNTLLAAPTIEEQLRQAIALLSDPGTEAYFQSRGLWDTLRKVLAAQAPDFGRLVTRGQSGLRLLHWLATIIPLIANDARSTGALLPSNSPQFIWAARWLEATGLAAQGGGTTRRAT